MRIARSRGWRRAHEALLGQTHAPLGIAGGDRERPQRRKGVGGQPLAPFIGSGEVGGERKFGAGERVVVFGDRDPTQRVVAPPDDRWHARRLLAQR